MNSTSSSISAPNLNHLSIDMNRSTPTETIPFTVSPKPKSLVSVYDNSFELHRPQQSIEFTTNSLLTIGILGGNHRAEVFEKRVISSGYSKPILCDVNWKEKLNYVSLETFQEFSPNIILVTEEFPLNLRESFYENSCQALIIDAREILSNEQNSLIYGSYRAFGNLSNWEIEHGTDRVPVAIESTSPVTLVQFIDQLKCFSRGTTRLDCYTYTHLPSKAFENCLFPCVSSLILLGIYSILSMIEYKNEMYHARLIYRQASSVTGSTSMTLLALLLLVRPIREFFELIHLTLFKDYPLKDRGILRLKCLEKWLKCRRYLGWYSFVFACLHLLFLFFSRIDSNLTLFIVAFILGLITFLCLAIFSSIHLPWISERLHWKEYHLFTSYLGVICLILSFLHVFFHWTLISDMWNVKFFAMILPLIVLITRLTIYGMVYPTLKCLHWIQHRS